MAGEEGSRPLRPAARAAVATRRVGWLGGSFDPVHDGHLHIARLALERLALDEVLLIPAARPPHKRDRVLASGADRLALLGVACAGEPRLRPCDIELHREGPSYSHDTALALRERLGRDAALYFVIGADTLCDLPTWYRIADLAQLVTFCAVTRPGSLLDAAPLQSALGAEATRRIEQHLLPAEPHPASSTAIRAALVAGEHPPHLPPGVWEAIVARGLYGAGGRSSRDSSGRSTA